jgi:hypothetical protein
MGQAECLSGAEAMARHQQIFTRALWNPFSVKLCFLPNTKSCHMAKLNHGISCGKIEKVADICPIKVLLRSVSAWLRPR